MSWASQQSGDRDPNGIVIFGGSGGTELSRKICSYLKLESAGVTLGRFPDGEMLVKVDEDVRGKVFAAMADAVSFKFLPAPLTKEQLSRLVLVPFK